METINQKIISLTKEIGLPGIRQNFKILEEEFNSSPMLGAENKENEYNKFLLRLLEIEFVSRLKSRKASRIRQAGFPYKKYIEDLKQEDLPLEAQKKLSELKQLEFIKQGRNIIFARNPGTGKTHISIALGI